MATIEVKGEHATAIIVEADPDNGLYSYECSAGSWCPRPVDPERRTPVGDAVAEAEVHVDCVEHPGHQA